MTIEEFVFSPFSTMKNVDEIIKWIFSIENWGEKERDVRFKERKKQFFFYVQ